MFACRIACTLHKNRKSTKEILPIQRCLMSQIEMSNDLVKTGISRESADAIMKAIDNSSLTRYDLGMIESKIDKLEKKIDGKFSTIEKKIDGKFSTLEEKFNTMEEKTKIIMYKSAGLIATATTTMIGTAGYIAKITGYI